MKTILSYLYILFLLLGISNTYAQNCNDAIHTGEGTFYGGVAGGIFGNCSLPVAADDFLHCALNNFDYDGSNACGSCIEVTGPNGSVTLKVVDRCPECASGDVDMTQEAFAMIADPIDGRVPISWKFIPCDSSESIRINFKEGSSEFWTAIQFRNIEHAVATMEYRNASNEWVNVNRELFNFFIETSGIPSPMDLRVTSILDEKLIFEDVTLNLTEDYDTGLQFSTPSECDGTLSIPEFNTTADIFYPNPTSEVLYFKNNSENWILSDNSGKILKQGNTESIDMSALDNGIYFISLHHKSIKIIKQ